MPFVAEPPTSLHGAAPRLASGRHRAALPSLCLHARRPVARSLIAANQLVDLDIERMRETTCVFVGQFHLAAFDTGDHRGTDCHQRSKLGLRKPKESPPIPGKALITRHKDKIAHMHAQSPRDKGQRVDLRTTRSSLPLLDGGTTETSSPGEVSPTHTFAFTQGRQPRRVEPPQDASTHCRIPFIARHLAAPQLRSNLCMTLNDANVVVGSPANQNLSNNQHHSFASKRCSEPDDASRSSHAYRRIPTNARNSARSRDCSSCGLQVRPEHTGSTASPSPHGQNDGQLQPRWPLRQP